MIHNIVLVIYRLQMCHQLITLVLHIWLYGLAFVVSNMITLFLTAPLTADLRSADSNELRARAPHPHCLWPLCVDNSR